MSPVTAEDPGYIDICELFILIAVISCFSAAPLLARDIYPLGVSRQPRTRLIDLYVFVFRKPTSRPRVRAPKSPPNFSSHRGRKVLDFRYRKMLRYTNIFTTVYSFAFSGIRGNRNRLFICDREYFAVSQWKFSFWRFSVIYYFLLFRPDVVASVCAYVETSSHDFRQIAFSKCENKKKTIAAADKLEYRTD